MIHTQVLALPATATVSKMLYVMTMDLKSLKAPPMYFPFIFTSVSLVVKKLTLYFQEAYKLPELLKKRGDEYVSTRAHSSGLSKVRSR